VTKGGGSPDKGESLEKVLSRESEGGDRPRTATPLIRVGPRRKRLSFPGGSSQQLLSKVLGHRGRRDSHLGQCQAAELNCQTLAGRRGGWGRPRGPPRRHIGQKRPRDGGTGATAKGERCPEKKRSVGRVKGSTKAGSRGAPPRRKACLVLRKRPETKDNIGGLRATTQRWKLTANENPQKYGGACPAFQGY